MEKRTENTNSPEEDFMSRLQMLSKLLLDDCRSNMQALSEGGQNYNEVFTYLRTAIRHLTNQCQRLRLRN
jgi:hypothetical protein